MGKHVSVADTVVDGLPALSQEGDTARLVLVPAAGRKIVPCVTRHTGHDSMWRSPWQAEQRADGEALQVNGVRSPHSFVRRIAVTADGFSTHCLGVMGPLGRDETEKLHTTLCLA